MRVVDGYDAFVGESHLRVLSDARPRRSVDGQFAFRQIPESGDGELTSLRLRDVWSSAEEEWQTGAESLRLEFAAGRPIRLFVGGFGGNRLLGVRPAPISFQLWRGVNQPMVNADDVSMEVSTVCVEARRIWPSASRPHPVVARCCGSGLMRVTNCVKCRCRRTEICAMRFGDR